MQTKFPIRKEMEVREKGRSGGGNYFNLEKITRG